MAIDLPKTIADYFAADRTKNAEDVAQCFTTDALVKDEGKTHSGQNAIRAWKAASSTQYSYTVDPFSLTRDGDHFVVSSHLEGNFLGSPVDLRYVFVLEGDKIAKLEILP